MRPRRAHPTFCSVFLVHLNSESCIHSMYSAVRLIFDRNTAKLVIPVSLRDEGGICGYKSPVYKLIRYWLCEGISRFFFEYWWLLHSFLALVPDDFNRNKKNNNPKTFQLKTCVQCFLENEETKSQKWQAKSCPWEKSLETNVALISWLLTDRWLSRRYS